MSLIKRLFAAEKNKNPNGRGLSIAFLDTGVSPVADFILPENRIVAFRDLVNGKTEPYDDNGHGTHVTGADNEKPLPFQEGAFPQFSIYCSIIPSY